VLSVSAPLLAGSIGAGTAGATAETVRFAFPAKYNNTQWDLGYKVS